MTHFPTQNPTHLPTLFTYLPAKTYPKFDQKIQPKIQKNPKKFFNPFIFFFKKIFQIPLKNFPTHQNFFSKAAKKVQKYP